MINNCNYVAKTAKAPEATWLFYKHLIGAEVQPQIARLGGGRFSANKRFKPTTLGAYEDADVWTATAANVRPLPLITKQADLDKEWADALKGMTEGRLGVRDGLLQVQTRAGQLLREGGCLC
jgi:ABC-type glycerol-3-phosphate transport system substrate-binding protein